MFRNPLGYACLNPTQLTSLMGPLPDKKPLTPLELNRIVNDLESNFDVPRGPKKSDGLFDGEFYIPPLLGKNIDDHFEAMAAELVTKAQPGIDFLSRNYILPFAVVSFTPQGLRYVHNTEKVKRSKPPEGEHLLLPDVETLLKHCKLFWTRFEWDPTWGCWNVSYPECPTEPGHFYDTETGVTMSDFAMPVMASAVTPISSYMWLHPAILDDYAGYGYDPNTHKITPFDSPMPSVGRGKFIVAHNSSYDSVRCKERYEFSNTPTNFFFCTMSGHQVMAGLNDDQRKGYAGAKKRHQKYTRYGSPKGLLDSYNFNVAGPMDWPLLEKDEKKIRDAFVKAPSMAYLREMLGELMNYSLRDSALGLQNFHGMWEAYLSAAPSKVVLAAHFLLAHSLLPVSDDWFDWINKVDAHVYGLAQEQMDLFIELAQEAHKFWQNGGDVESDPWLNQLDWTIKGVESSPEATQLNEDRELKTFHKVEEFMSLGVKPVASWFMACKGGSALTAKKRDAHHLLKLSYKHDGVYYPVTHLKDYGWCYYDADKEVHRVPHKTGDPDANVGGLITSDYLAYLEDGRMKSDA